MVARNDESAELRLLSAIGVLPPFAQRTRSTKEKALRDCDKLRELVELDAPLELVMGRIILLMKKAVRLSAEYRVAGYIERTLASGGEPFGDPE